MTPRDYHHPKINELTLTRVLVALSDLICLEMIRRLADGQEHDSPELTDDLSWSTLAYHTRMLREVGVTWVRGEDHACLIRLRRDDLDRLLLDVLAAVVANTGSGAAQA